jgi:beta-lactamase superfamily II metal-dependent hydrolase
LGRLAERGIAVLRTDALGMVSIHTDGASISLDTEHWSPKRGIAAVFDR